MLPTSFRHFRAILIGSICSLLLVVSAHAREVTVGVFDNPPIVFEISPGKPAGIAIDILDEIARKEGWTLRYRHAPWDTLLSELGEGKLDVLVGIAYTQERATKFRFTEQTLVTNWGVLYHHPNRPITSLMDLNGKRVASMRRSTHTQAFVALANSFGLKVNVLEVDSYDQVLEKVATGEADAGVVNRIFSAVGADRYKVAPTSIVFNPIDVRYASPRSVDPAIARAIDNHLSRLKADPSSVYYASLHRWLEGKNHSATPRWIIYLLAGSAGALALALGVAALLRRRVRQATHALARKAQALEREVAEHTRTASALRTSEDRWQFALEGSGDGVWDWDPSTNRVFYSRQWRRMLGYDEDVGDTLDVWQTRLHPEDRDRAWDAVSKVLDGTEEQLNIEHRLLCRDGDYKWVLGRGKVVQRDAAGKPLRMIGTMTDIGQIKAAQAQIEYLATRDPLTELPNRLLLGDRLEQTIYSAQRDGTTLALMFLDLDRFKYINDSLGHQIGDELLRQVATRILAHVRKEDTVSRLGGDEFVVMLKGVRDLRDVSHVARTILESVSAPYEVEGHQLNTSCSIGISLFPADARDAQTLMRNADTAMYHAKDAGRNRYQFFSPEMNQRAVERLSLENDLRRALERDEFHLLYQPVVRVDSGAIVGVEALLRWHHPERGVVGPALFLAVAEETGLMDAIGAWVLEEACRQGALWQRQFDTPLRVAVNLSVSQVRPAITGQIRELLARTGFDAEWLELEITEDLLMENFEANADVLRAIGDLGVGIAIDDFGVGYSSLSYLQRLPIDTVKIDRSFVHDLPRSKDTATIVRAIMAMTNALRLRTVAEGVEIPEQLAMLTHLGCDEYQGFRFSPPVEAAEIEQLLLDRSPATRRADH